ncbi:hypothetical protein ACLM5J_06725 [Nocardioides sp. Bht2]|uniref:hypothetical protein n=1 Tax=Nocardioides sp. Bht2 TaxID=3392297 RepID=UPI0039B45508
MGTGGRGTSRTKDSWGSERGDVPGWVLLAVMTAGIVAGLWEFAGGELQAMLRDALGSVRG